MRSKTSFKLVCSFRSIHWPAALILLYAYTAATSAEAVTSTSPDFSMSR